MNSVITISKSKVAPASLPPKKNNFVQNEFNIVNQSTFLIYTEVLLGINRLYLFKFNDTISKLSVVFSLVLWCINVVFCFKYMTIASIQVFKYTLCIEYTFFVIIATASSKNLFKMFFKNVSTFDETLNIRNESKITRSMKRDIICTVACGLSNAFEIYLVITVLKSKDNFPFIFIFIMSLSHDIEQVFFYTFLRDIYLRILILKAHVAKMFDANDKTEKMSKTEKLCEKVQFDVTTLHRMYELLHKCSQQLNLTMNFQILIIFFVSSLTSIMLLKKLISAFQSENQIENLNLLIIYVVYRCLKFTILLVIPCYYSSVTAGQTTLIRTILHDAVNNMPMNKTERRKVKTFFHLTRESDFSYAICGVIKLDMSLPLSYMNLCTTYLVIIIQFSKFLE